LSQLIGANLPFFLFYPSILLVAWMAGFGPGMFAVFLSAASAMYLFPRSAGDPSIGLSRNTNGVILFSIVGVVISRLADIYRRRMKRLQEFERAVEGLEEMIVVIDRDYRYLIANRAFLNYRGLKREELLGRRIAEVLSPGIFESTVKEKVDECFQGKIVQFEMRYRYTELGERDLFISYFPVEGAGGVDRVACVLQDITDRKQAEHSLKLFRTLIDQSNDAVEVVDPETLRFLDVNEKACQDLGYTREELLSLTVYDIDPTVDEASHSTFLTRLRDAGSEVKETIHRRKDGSIFPVETSLKCVQLDRSYVVAVSRDITKRKIAQEALRASEDGYRDLVEHSEDLVCTHDLQGRLLSVNPAPARLLGYEVEELIKIPMHDLIAPECREQFEGYLDRIKTTGADKGYLCVLTKGGERKIWEYNNTLRTEGVASPTVRGMAHDVTERKGAEAAQRSSEQRYRLLFEKNVAGVAIANMDGVLVDCNVGWARILGYESAEEIRGRRTAEFYFNLAERAPLLDKLKREGAFFSQEMQLRRKDGTPVWVSFNSALLAGIDTSPKLMQATAIDITKRKMAEEALRRREEDYRRFLAQSSEGIFREDLDAPVPVDRPVDELVHHIIHDSYLAECNDATARMYGFSVGQELVGKRVTEMLVATDARNIEMTRKYVESGFRLLDHESHELDIHGNPKVFSNSLIGIVEDGKLVRTWGIQRDVTERVKAEDGKRKAERTLAESEERFRVALLDSPIMVFSQDRELRYTWIYNPQLYWQNEALGRTDAEIIGRKEAAKLVELKQSVLKTGVALRKEVVIPHDGRNYAFDITIEPLFDADGTVMGITGASMDIARLREMTDRLQDARDKLAQEKSYLEGEIQAELGFEEIIGQSPALREVLKLRRPTPLFCCWERPEPERNWWRVLCIS
jgi:PAS domain S-box-containing protein